MRKLLLAFILGMMLFHTSASATIDGKAVKRFVERFYSTVLDREADIPGLMDWTNKLTTGVSAGSDVATGFIFSDEFIGRDTSDTEFLNILYQAFFNRASDVGGMGNWTAQLSSGVSREDVLNGFLYSTEFSNLTASYGIKAVPEASSTTEGGSVEDFVKRFYSVVLGRTADSAGLYDWVEKLNSGTQTGSDIATGFVFSSEFDETSKDDNIFINVLYKAFFNRDADAGGLNGWLTKLQQGTSREDVLNGFLYSQEFVNLCDSYHIKAYEGALVYKLARVEDDWGGVEEYTYDEQGRLIIDRVDYSSSTQTTTYRYNAEGKIIEKRYLEQDQSGYEDITTTTYTYDVNGKLLSDTLVTTINGGSTTVTLYTYDANARKISKKSTTTSGDGTGNIIDTVIITEYTYTASGKIKTEKWLDEYSAGFNIIYDYDANDILFSEIAIRLDGVGIESGWTEIYYDTHGNEKIMYDEDATTGTGEQFYGSKIYSAFDPLGHEVAMVHELWGNSGSSYCSYTYDLNHNVTSKKTLDENGDVFRTVTYEWIKVP